MENIVVKVTTEAPQIPDIIKINDSIFKVGE